MCKEADKKNLLMDLLQALARPRNRRASAPRRTQRAPSTHAQRASVRAARAVRRACAMRCVGRHRHSAGCHAERACRTGRSRRSWSSSTPRRERTSSPSRSRRPVKPRLRVRLRLRLACARARGRRGRASAAFPRSTPRRARRTRQRTRRGRAWEVERGRRRLFVGLFVCLFVWLVRCGQLFSVAINSLPHCARVRPYAQA